MSISNESRSRIKAIFEPIALGMGRLGLTPNGLTLIGFAITVAGSILVGLQAWVVGGIVVFIGGVFDMFDGTLARATGKVSNFGAFMDSTFDKLRRDHRLPRRHRRDAGCGRHGRPRPGRRRGDGLPRSW